MGLSFFFFMCVHDAPLLSIFSRVCTMDVLQIDTFTCLMLGLILAYSSSAALDSGMEKGCPAPAFLFAPLLSPLALAILTSVVHRGTHTRTHTFAHSKLTNIADTHAAQHTPNINMKHSAKIGIKGTTAILHTAGTPRCCRYYHCCYGRWLL